MSDAVNTTVSFIAQGILDLSSVKHNQVVPIKHIQVAVRASNAFDRCGVFIETGD